MMTGESCLYLFNQLVNRTVIIKQVVFATSDNYDDAVSLGLITPIQQPGVNVIYNYDPSIDLTHMNFNISSKEQHDNIGEKKSSKRLTKSVISNALSPQPVLTPVDNKPQHECNTTKCGTPLANRLSKRKITSSSVTDMKNNGKPAKANSCGGSASSITSKKRRR
ncbi:unnamed protein product [Adineta steineri]|uniref:Uncharacterized protein n=1 Tax=Adineta steineri TaxID=433720 RepID=A0A819QLJ9_9BILA|nr:unnamed protein product [Adineta steineri]